MESVRQTAFRDVPFLGVIRVVVEATRLGYRAEDPAWSNLGQGQPEVGELDGAPSRIDHVAISPADHAYAPVEELAELRECVAAYDNRLYRRGKRSQYAAAVAGDGTTGLADLALQLSNFGSVCQ